MVDLNFYHPTNLELKIKLSQNKTYLDSEKQTFYNPHIPRFDVSLYPRPLHILSVNQIEIRSDTKNSCG